MRSPCGAGREAILTGWSATAPPVELPPGVSYSVGAGTGIATLVLQVSPCQLRLILHFWVRRRRDLCAGGTPASCSFCGCMAAAADPASERTARVHAMRQP